MRRKKIKINMIVGKDFLSKIDSYSERNDMNRSEFIREAVETYIVSKKEEQKLKEKEKKIKDAINFFKKMGDKNKNWDGVKEINKWREKL